MPASPSTQQRSTKLSDLRLQLAHYIDSLFSDRVGWVGCGLGVGGYYAKGAVKKKTYTFRHGVRHEFFKWPEERSALIRWVMDNRRDYDVLINPILRSEASLAKGYALDGSYAWCDIDIDLDRHTDLIPDIERLLSRGSLIVVSGGRGGIHVYIALDRPYPRKTIESLNKAVRDYINYFATAHTNEKADNLWSENSLLRPPGTLNQKGRATRGARPYPVYLDRDYECAHDPWTAEGLAKRLKLPYSYSPQQKKPARSRTIKPVGPPAAYELAALPFTLSPRLKALTGFYVPKGTDKTRSAQLFGLIAAAIEEGYTDEELLFIGRCSAPAQERARERAGERWRLRLSQDVMRCIERLRPDHDHVMGDQLQVMWDEFLRDYRPKTNTRTTDRLVFGAFISVARQIGSFDVDMSIRRLALLAARNPKTVWKSLQRIIRAGFLTQLQEPHLGTKIPRAMTANTYHLNWRNARATTHAKLSSHSQEHVGMCTTFDASGNDAARFTALGNAYATHQALVSGMSSVTEIAQFVGFTEQTILRHLTKLEALSLAEQKPDGTWISHRRPWDEVAEELGTAGTHDRKAADYQRERDAHREELRRRVNDEADEWAEGILARGGVMVAPGVFMGGL